MRRQNERAHYEPSGPGGTAGQPEGIPADGIGYFSGGVSGGGDGAGDLGHVGEEDGDQTPSLWQGRRISLRRSAPGAGCSGTHRPDFQNRHGLRSGHRGWAPLRLLRPRGRRPALPPISLRADATKRKGNRPGGGCPERHLPRCGSGGSGHLVPDLPLRSKSGTLFHPGRHFAQPLYL